MTSQDAFLHAFFTLPSGSFNGTASGKRYVVVRLEMVGGKSHKLIAHERGGSDYVSLNLYLTQSEGTLLRPCEMPVAKVRDFVLALVPDG